jgi:hypothetical protein
MLEQAIVDAQALREAALKNAEQSVIEKYAPEIKAAVESLLEGDNKQEVIKEEYNIPYASDPVDEEQNVEMVVEYEFNPEDFSLDLNSLQEAPEQAPEESAMDIGIDTPVATEEAPPAADAGGLEDLLSESDLSEDNDLVSEILAILGESDEEEVIDEGLTVDVGAEKHGWVTTDDATRKYDQELELAKRQSDEYKNNAEQLTGELEGLKVTLANYQTNQDKLHSAVADMKDKLEEALISNARLLYTNKVLSDASLNERQKSKLVEVIAKAETIKEAKSLYETLKEATVGATKKSPQSLSESVNRRSNLSHVMPRRKQETLNENNSFSERMKKLAGLD